MIGDVFAGITAAATIATASGVVVGALQLRASKQQAMTSFEDDLDREYRQIVGQLPPLAFFKDATERIDEDSHRAFYRYFDLCNDQLFMIRQGRIRSATASQWRDGIGGNLTLPSFRTAWNEIARGVPEGFFEDLRSLVPPERPATYAANTVLSAATREKLD